MEMTVVVGKYASLQTTEGRTEASSRTSRVYDVIKAFHISLSMSISMEGLVIHWGDALGFWCRDVPQTE